MYKRHPTSLNLQQNRAFGRNGKKISTGSFKMEITDEDMFHKESGQRSEKQTNKRVYEKKCKSDKGNYRLVSVLSNIGKALEALPYHIVSKTRGNLD